MFAAVVGTPIHSSRHEATTVSSGRVGRCELGLKDSRIRQLQHVVLSTRSTDTPHLVVGGQVRRICVCFSVIISSGTDNTKLSTERRKRKARQIFQNAYICTGAGGSVRKTGPPTLDQGDISTFRRESSEVVGLWVLGQ